MVSLLKIFSVFCITTLLFLTGYLVGEHIGSLGFDLLEKTRDDLLLQVVSLDAQYELLRENPCEISDPGEFSEGLDELGRRLAIAERNKMDFATIQKFYEYYYVLELKHFLLVKDINEKCENRYVPVLFFYDNSDCKVCKEQGLILSRVKSEDPKTIMVYSFNTDSTSPVVKTLKEQYNIKRTPTIVISDDAQFDDLTSAKRISKAVDYIKITENKN